MPPMAAEEGWFELADVARSVHDKLHARHPHVFGPTGADDRCRRRSTVEELAVSWEAAKRAEKDRGSVMDGIARGLPALALAEKVLKKAASVGLEPTEPASAADALRALLDALDDPGAIDDAVLGRVAVELAGIARRAGIDAEMATRAEAVALARTCPDRRGPRPARALTRRNSACPLRGK